LTKSKNPKGFEDYYRQKIANRDNSVADDSRLKTNDTVKTKKLNYSSLTNSRVISQVSLHQKNEK